MYGCYVLHNRTLLDTAHKLLQAQGLPGEFELLDAVVRLRRQLLLLHLHLTDPDPVRSQSLTAICIRSQTDLQQESLQIGLFIHQLPLILAEGFYQPCDQAGGEDGSVRPVEVLEVNQGIQPA